MTRTQGRIQTEAKANESARQIIRSSVAPRVIVAGRPQKRRTYQLRSTVTGFTKVADCVQPLREWVARKTQTAIPSDFWRGDSRPIEDPGQKIEVVAAGKNWALRLIQPDSPFGDREAVAGRSWCTDVGFHLAEPHTIEMGIRVTCASMPFCAEEPVLLTRPALVRELARRFEMRDCVRISEKPWLLSAEDDVQTLYEFVLSGKRQLPVIVLTEPDSSRFPMKLRRFLLDGDQLSRDVAGWAHVVLIPKELNLAWTMTVGKTWSVFGGAIRTYQPGLDRTTDSPYAHPLALPNAVLAYANEHRIAEEAFADLLLSRAQAFSASRPLDWGTVLFAPEVSLERARTRQDSARSEQEKIVALQERIQSLDELLEEERREAQEFCDLATQREQERDEVRAENHLLRLRLDGLNRQIEGTSSPTTTAPRPSEWNDIPEWVESELIGKLILHPRARRALKDAQFEDIDLALDSLLLLANHYRDMRLGYPEAMESYRKRRDELRLTDGASIEMSRAGEFGDEYFVRYPEPSDQRRFLESHLRKGTSRDARNCLAI